MLSLLTIVPVKLFGHCPLCTGGAAAAAGAAALLGVNYGAIGVFLGAFATALGLWTPKLLKKRYVPLQKPLVFWVVYLSTLLPLIPFTRDYSSVYISRFGDYGSIGNRTYLINWFIVGAVLGSLIVYISPFISTKITDRRKGKAVRFQGLGITFALLIITAVSAQVLR
jgi:hypothetical protein